MNILVFCYYIFAFLCSDFNALFVTCNPHFKTSLTVIHFFNFQQLAALGGINLIMIIVLGYFVTLEKQAVKAVKEKVSKVLSSGRYTLEKKQSCQNV